MWLCVTCDTPCGWVYTRVCSRRYCRCVVGYVSGGVAGCVAGGIAGHVVGCMAGLVAGWYCVAVVRARHVAGCIPVCGRVCSRDPLQDVWLGRWACGPAHLLPPSLIPLGHCNMRLCHLLLLVLCGLLHVLARNYGLRIPRKGRIAVPTGAPEPLKAPAPPLAVKQGPPPDSTKAPSPAPAQALASAPLKSSGEPIPADVPDEVPKAGAPPAPSQVVCLSPSFLVPDG